MSVATPLRRDHRGSLSIVECPVRAIATIRKDMPSPRHHLSANGHNAFIPHPLAI
ncbi:hypothetical protein RHMOL_Rhmol06G0087000 [Rhododendron molle]|uniref:Uncharacterized protein n=1 Tax=Rhododendron molle TaxID=49168 RepID=A0ACC0NA65_RHOML|nr:hypothetical protein RHMOL_Rhmol06G0087000 [Rhododendron molle]